jgi:hypothetical protein
LNMVSCLEANTYGSILTGAAVDNIEQHLDRIDQRLDRIEGHGGGPSGGRGGGRGEERGKGRGEERGRRRRGG